MTPDHAACLAWVKGYASDRREDAALARRAGSDHLARARDNDADYFDVIAALLEAQGWQPIATAPQDDAPVVLYMGTTITIPS